MMSSSKKPPLELTKPSEFVPPPSPLMVEPSPICAPPPVRSVVSPLESWSNSSLSNTSSKNIVGVIYTFLLLNLFHNIFLAIHDVDALRQRIERRSIGGDHLPAEIIDSISSLDVNQLAVAAHHHALYHGWDV